MSPQGVKAMLAPPVDEIVTVGVGFAVVKSARENSTTHP
jgi:hypothetical protein